MFIEYSISLIMNNELYNVPNLISKPVLQHSCVGSKKMSYQSILHKDNLTVCYQLITNYKYKCCKYHFLQSFEEY